MGYVFLKTAADMKWLRDVHLRLLPKEFKSALVKGNEDYPDRIEVYRSKDPEVGDPKVVFEPDGLGNYGVVKCSTCGGSGQRSTAKSADGRELERHEKRGTPCDSCGGSGSL